MKRLFFHTCILSFIFLTFFASVTFGMTDPCSSINWADTTHCGIFTSGSHIGEGAFCGSNNSIYHPGANCNIGLSANPNTLYYCKKSTGTTASTQDCTLQGMGCQVNFFSSSSPDICSSSAPIIQPTPTLTPTVTLTLTPTVGPTNTPTPTPTVTPTLSPTTTLTPMPGATAANITVHFEGIDRQNNINPKHLQRKLTLYFYKTNNFSNNSSSNLIAVRTDLLTYVRPNLNNPSAIDGFFTNPNFNLGMIPTDDYFVLMRSQEGSVREQVSPSQLTHIQTGGDGTVNIIIDPSDSSNVQLLQMGDLDNSGNVGIGDFNIIVDCYGVKSITTVCKAHNVTDIIFSTIPYVDINDDGEIDGIDYNILIRNFGLNSL
jgi:hypothetical protein